MKKHGCRGRRWSPMAALLVIGSMSVALVGCGGHSQPAAEHGEKASPGASHGSQTKPSAPTETVAQPTPRTEIAPKANVQPEAQRVLDEMVAAYRKATSYRDQGYVHLDMKVADRDMNEKFPFAVSLARPNQIRMDIYTASLACDGKKLRATVQGLANQILEKDAPANLSMRNIFADQVLGQAMHQGPAGGSPQVLLLVDEDPLGSMLQTADKVTLDEPGTIDHFTCDRVAIVAPEGRGVLWIDRQSRILRRVELPVDEIRKQASAEGKVDHVKITAELAGAEFDAPIDAQKFQLDALPTAKAVKMLIPPEPAQLLSKKLPAFKFFDLATKPVTPESLAGKVTVIEFWGTNCPPCRTSMPNLEKVYQKYKSNPKVAFLCVNVDPPTTKNDAVAALFKELGATAPLARDTEGQVLNLFYTNGIPAMFLVGSDGTIEDFEAGSNPDLVTVLPAKIEKLLAGQHLYEQGVKEYQQRLQNLEEAADRGPDFKPQPGEEVRRELPPAQIAEASPPKSLKLKPLWKSTDVKSPGNLLVVPGADGMPRILVINEWRTVAELSRTGKLVTTHALDLPGSEVVSFLRTVETGGRRWFAASTVGMQQVHVYDENWKPLFHFPHDALENKHAGIFDALLADLNGDGKPLLAVGYWGAVGVQGVSLEGKRLWSNRSMENVFRLASTAKDSAGKRSLLCLNSRGTLVALDGEGNRKEEIAIGSRPVQLMVGADLAGDGRLQYCGLAAKQLGVYVALGLDLRGKELWSYDLPPGHPNLPIEQIVAGQITAALPGQWILPAADGSIHILAADGKPIDRFNYGAALCGVGTAQINGRPVLVVASPAGVEALEVGP